MELECISNNLIDIKIDVIKERNKKPKIGRDENITTAAGSILKMKIY
jgi:hypothetical protein